MVLGEKEQALGVGEAHVSALGRPQPAPPMMMPAGREEASHVRGASEPHTLRPPSERVTVHALFSRCVRVRPLLENRTGPLRLHEAGGGGGRQAAGSGGRRGPGSERTGRWFSSALEPARPGDRAGASSMPPLYGSS